MTNQSSSRAAIVAAEVAYAVEGLRVMDMLGRGLVHPRYRGEDGASLAAEDAYEGWRDALSAEAKRSAPGLVSVPTSDTRSVCRFRSSGLADAARTVVADVLGTFAIDADAGRIAKLRQAVGFTARVHCTALPASWRCVMLTLTYAGDNSSWSPLHVSELLKRIRQWLGRRDVPFRYAWVAELQKRGVIHYHVATWLPPDVDLPMPDRCGWWPHGMTRIETARAAVPYLMKYLSKGNKASDHKLPGGARAYGVGGLGVFMRLARRWLSLPGFIKARADVQESAEWRRVPGGGWTDGDGVVWASEFERVSVGGVWMLRRVVDHGRPEIAPGCVASGPFSRLAEVH